MVSSKVTERNLDLEETPSRHPTSIISTSRSTVGEPALVFQKLRSYTTTSNLLALPRVTTTFMMAWTSVCGGIG
jgi:hypothetical protein